MAADMQKTGKGVWELLRKCSPNPKDAGNTLLCLNAIGMLFAAASNTAASAIDKNTSSEDKKFLIPAGVVTGVANIGIYFLMTRKLIKYLEKSALNYVNNMKDAELVTKATDFAKRAVKKAEKGIFKKPELAVSMKKDFFKGGDVNGAIEDAAKLAYKDNVKAAASVAGAFAGAIIGCSILTPIIRDVGAYFIQKKMEKSNPDLKNKPYRPYYDPSRVGTGIYNRRQPLSMTSFKMYLTKNYNDTMKI